MCKEENWTGALAENDFRQKYRICECDNCEDCHAEHEANHELFEGCEFCKED